MHAVLRLNPSPTEVLDYHEKKVKQKVAECIGAENFTKDYLSLNYADKLYPFELRASYNDSVKKKMFHSSLQFGTRTEISNEKMATIAREYMEEMGRGDDPFLLYRHRDAAQEHLHIVSSNIDRDGDVIGISRHDLYKSAAITERLTDRYRLPSPKADFADIPEALKHLDQGLRVLHPVMNRILEEVIPQYRYTNLAELNAVLRLYHIEASRGKEDSVTYQKKGLHYHPLKEDGQPAREYLPARRFSSRPTLANLEKRFVENQTLRMGHRESLTVLIDYSLAGKSLSLGALQKTLAKRRVSVVTGGGSGDGGRIWYIDHSHKTVFEEGALGDAYSFTGLQRRLVSEEAYQQQQEVQRQSPRIRPSF